MRHLLAALFLILPSLSAAAPYVPQSEAVVLERLPLRRDDPAMAELRKLRAAAAAAPQDPAHAAKLARRYFSMAAAEGDPRYVGYAEAALRPWRSEQGPTEVLFVRALLRQYRHDFEGGLQDLERALRQEPRHVGARSWRAAIFMVRAEYAAARAECSRLAEHASELTATGCDAYVDATTGAARAAYERLSRALRRSAEASPEGRLWALTRLAEMAWRLQEHDAAERHFNAALALGIDDNFLLAAYADFLLERDRPREAIGLLKAWTRSDTLLLRLALAEQRLGMREASGHVRALGERFAASTLRAERLHLGEEARYLLELKREPGAALAIAAENWKTQREPRDAAVFLEAAVAANDRKAAEPVLRWLEESGFESKRLAALAAKLK
jgi:hypothetical protein